MAASERKLIITDVIRRPQRHVCLRLSSEIENNRDTFRALIFYLPWHHPPSIGSLPYGVNLTYTYTTTLKKILIIEDDVDTIELVQAILNFAGYAVIKV